MSTHDYRKAVGYYRKALRGQSKSVPLRHDLARLCLKLGRFRDATGVLQEVRPGACLGRGAEDQVIYEGWHTH